jgi:hypothetical protein
VYAFLAEIDILRGDAAAAMRDARQEIDPEYGPWIRAMAPQIGPDRRQADAALHEYIAKYDKTQPYAIAELYALRKQPDDVFEWLQRA